MFVIYKIYEGVCDEERECDEERVCVSKQSAAAWNSNVIPMRRSMNIRAEQVHMTKTTKTKTGAVNIMAW